MSSGALYRKYRSKTFNEVIGQEHITTTLLNSINNNSFSHAYLFTGPRGVGKTSVARLFAYQVNNLEYNNDDKTYSDIIEIDAASNRRIDEIRELREKISTAPSVLKYKIYIIDEVHMLTKEAFNALLKTLEEPPEHAVFVLATTDFHKVPDTIVSRCVRFAFLAIPPQEIKKHLQKIAKKESIKIEDKALDIIAGNSEGSFRDAISLLDQFKNSKTNISAEYVSKILGLSPISQIAKIVEAVGRGKPKELVDTLDKLKVSGASDGQIIKQLINYLRECLIEDKDIPLDNKDLVKLINDLLTISTYSDNIGLALEITLIGAMKNDRTSDNNHRSEPPKTAQENSGQQRERTAGKKVEKKEVSKSVLSGDLWQSVLSDLKKNNSSLYAIARMADSYHEGDTLELHFKFPFHYKQMKLERNLLLIKQIVKSKHDAGLEIKVLMKGNPNTETGKQSASKDSGKPVESVSNIFGPSEVLES